MLLPPEIKAVLGFTADRFRPGTYMSDKAVDEGKYSAIPADMVFQCHYFAELKQFMKEPKSTDIQHVMQALNDAFTDTRMQDFLVEFYYEASHLILNNIATPVEIKLPQLLANYFGTSADRKFLSGSKILLTAEEVHEQEETEYVDEKRATATATPGEPRRLLICSNIVKDMPYGNSLVNFLQEIPLDNESNTEVSIEFQPVQYLPLASSQVNQIRINFLDEKRQPVEFQKKDTSVTLEFRPKY